LITGFPTRVRRSHGNAKPIALAATMLVCLALVVLLTVVQVAHVHEAASGSDRCPLCMTMHSAAPVSASAAVILLVQVAAAAPVLEVRTPARHWHPQLFTRPPPSAC